MYLPIYDTVELFVNLNFNSHRSRQSNARQSIQEKLSSTQDAAAISYRARDDDKLMKVAMKVKTLLAGLINSKMIQLIQSIETLLNTSGHSKLRRQETQFG